MQTVDAHRFVPEQRFVHPGASVWQVTVSVANGNAAYAWAMASLILFGLIGLGAALLLPATLHQEPA